MRILIVEDHPEIRDALSLGLQAHGHEIVAACNGFSALAAIGENIPDVMVTDLDMPGMNGLELIKQVRRAHPHLPIVAMSGRECDVGATLGAVRGLDRGCKLHKPFTTGQLLGAIDHARAVT